MKILLWTLFAVVLGFIGGMVLSEIIGIVGYLVFHQLMGVRLLPVYTALASAGATLAVGLMLSQKARRTQQ